MGGKTLLQGAKTAMSQSHPQNPPNSVDQKSNVSYFLTNQKQKIHTHTNTQPYDR